MSRPRYPERPTDQTVRGLALPVASMLRAKATTQANFQAADA